MRIKNREVSNQDYIPIVSIPVKKYIESVAQTIKKHIMPTLTQSKSLNGRVQVASNTDISISLREKISSVPFLGNAIILTHDYMTRNSYTLSYLSSDVLKSDYSYVLQAVRKNGQCLKHASYELRNNKVIVEEALRNDSSSFQYASDELRNNQDFILETMCNGPGVKIIYFIGNKLRKDKKFILEATKKEPLVLLEYIKHKQDSSPLSILSLEEIVELAIVYNKFCRDETPLVEDLIYNWERFSFSNEQSFHYSITFIGISTETITKNIKNLNLTEEQECKFYDELIQKQTKGCIVHPFDMLGSLNEEQESVLINLAVEKCPRCLIRNLESFISNSNKEQLFDIIEKLNKKSAYDLQYFINKRHFSTPEIYQYFEIHKLRTDLKIKNYQFLKKLFKDERKFKPFLSLAKFLNNSHIPKNEIDKILSLIFSNTKEDLIHTKISFILSLLELKKIDLILDLPPLNLLNMKEVMVHILNKELDINIDLKLLNSKFKRNPFSILTYLAKINTLIDTTEKAEMIETFKAFLLSGLYNDDKNTWRANSPHLRYLSEKFNISQDLINRWIGFEHREEISLEDFEVPPQNILFHDFLKDKIIGNNQTRYYFTAHFPLLHSYLTGAKNSEECLTQIKDLRLKYQRNKTGKELKTAIPTDLVIEEKLLMACLNNQYNILEIQKIIIKQVNNNPHIFTPFLTQLKLFIENSCPLSKKQRKLYFQVSQNPEDILLLGYETGGCQNVNEDIDLNKCLLGYADSKNKIFSITNENGTMIARCIVKLLWDEEKHSAILFAEPVYTLNPDDKIMKALYNMTNKIQKNLDMQLVFTRYFFRDEELSKNILGNRNFIILQSFGCISPFEYSDSLHDDHVIKRGQYTIYN